jgi:hypothetical protein
VKKQLFRMFDYAVYGFQWIALYFFQGFTAGTVALVFYVGLYIVTAAWLITIFGEERTTAFITNHPYLFVGVVVLFTVCTGGLAYWSYTRDGADLDANLRRRLAKHSNLFKVA